MKMISASFGGVALVTLLALATAAQEQRRPAFVLVERIATTGPQSIQDDYAKLARDILPKYGARYLAQPTELPSRRRRGGPVLHGDARISQHGGRPALVRVAGKSTGRRHPPKRRQFQDNRDRGLAAILTKRPFRPQPRISHSSDCRARDGVWRRAALAISVPWIEGTVP
jgi:hypothetical protein